tara:strand:- start:527 stop:949 length:423 start_codon:yes stop_codon:yes gene_type:complete
MAEYVIEATTDDSGYTPPDLVRDPDVALATSPNDPIRDFFIALTKDPRFREHYRPGTRGNNMIGLAMRWDDNLNPYIRSVARVHYISTSDNDVGVLVEITTDNGEVTLKIGETNNGLQDPQLTGPALNADEALEQLIAPK